MKSISTLQYDAEDLVQLVLRTNPEALVHLVLRDLASRGYAVSSDQLGVGPNGSIVVTDAQVAAPPAPLPQIQAQAPAPPFQPWAQGQPVPVQRSSGFEPQVPQPWAPPVQPQWQQTPPPPPPQPAPAAAPLYVAEPLPPPAPRIQAPPPPTAAPAGPSPLASRVFGAPHAAEVQTGLPQVAGEEVLGRTPSGTLFTRLGTRPSLAGALEGEGDGYPDLASLQSDAPTMTSRPGDGSDPRFNAVDIPNLEQPRDPRVREVGRASGLADKVQREGLFSDGAAPPRLTGTGGFAWNPQGPGQGDPGPRPSFLDAFVQNPNKD